MFYATLFYPTNAQSKPSYNKQPRQQKTPNKHRNSSHRISNEEVVVVDAYTKNPNNNFTHRAQVEEDTKHSSPSSSETNQVTAPCKVDDDEAYSTRQLHHAHKIQTTTTINIPQTSPTATLNVTFDNMKRHLQQHRKCAQTEPNNAQNNPQTKNKPQETPRLDSA